MKKCLAMMLTVALLMPLSSVYAKSSLTMNKWQTVKGDPKKKITYQVKVPKTSYVSFSWKDADRKDGYIKLTRKKKSYKIHDQQFKVIYLRRGTYKLSYHGEDHKQSRKIKMTMHRKSQMPTLKLHTYKSFNVKKHEVIAYKVRVKHKGYLKAQTTLLANSYVMSASTRQEVNMKRILKPGTYYVFKEALSKGKLQVQDQLVRLSSLMDVKKYNEPAKACPLTFGRTYEGQTTQDRVYFKFTLKEKTKITGTFDLENAERILHAKDIDEMDEWKLAEVAAVNIEQSKQTFTLKKGTYYLVLANGSEAMYPYFKFTLEKK